METMNNSWSHAELQSRLAHSKLMIIAVKVPILSAPLDVHKWLPRHFCTIWHSIQLCLFPVRPCHWWGEVVPSHLSSRHLSSATVVVSKSPVGNTIHNFQHLLTIPFTKDADVSAAADTVEGNEYHCLISQWRKEVLQNPGQVRRCDVWYTFTQI